MQWIAAEALAAHDKEDKYHRVDLVSAPRNFVGRLASAYVLTRS